ncbi:PilZ domain-containing protein [Microvirga tunisiensis]|uniref:PilZ domain-containing protein n=2 Tax=Pannonibacter tanglangensis TaxID=2750084 RepID=A0ABW9ZH95_9HYPH|nr:MULTISPECIES: PilZ domain-containing protein [unclassified Pannonibacter]NBN64068.1 PilZ domain-containing protein [Pannonibacter sp. XCT-34]NBN77709.1 PilZ domain-containing protein [Pannonibacter sp. XCT-53]
MDERRAAPRMRVLKAGRIVFGNGMRVYDCMLRNSSEGGVLLKVPSTHDVPDEFMLYVDTDQIRRPVQIVWRKADQLGVRFTGPAEPVRAA